jgi:hypothetical protein
MIRYCVTRTMEVLAGLVERITFHNEENGFCVLRVKVRGQRDLITVVGHAASIAAVRRLTSGTGKALCCPYRDGGGAGHGVAARSCYVWWGERSAAIADERLPMLLQQHQRNASGLPMLEANPDFRNRVGARPARPRRKTSSDRTMSVARKARLTLQPKSPPI